MQLESKFTKFKLLTTKHTGFTDVWHISMPPLKPKALRICTAARLNICKEPVSCKEQARRVIVIRLCFSYVFHV